jgi:N-acetylmuramic acid 6-phosphate etherase
MNNEILLENMMTESRNKNSHNIDTANTREILRIMNSEDKTVPLAVEKELDHIERAVDIIVKSLKKRARLIYIGAGTSGRLGVLDASECPPTFGTDPEQILGIIAGGDYALRNAVENAEDDLKQGVSDLKAVGLCKNDVVVGIAASGRTPYVLGAIEYAKELGCETIGIGCNPFSELSKRVDVSIAPLVGAEIVTGSTRLKAGTAQKLVLNMLTTTAMIKLGKVFGNLMVDVQATNGKLIERQKKIIMEATGVSQVEAAEYYALSDGKVKAAIVMILGNCGKKAAEQALLKAEGNVRKALSLLTA